MCPLNGYPEDFRCGGGMDNHHILRRGLAGYNREVKKHLDHWSLKTPICHNHNISRWPDAPKGRRILLLRANTVTRGATRRVVESIPWKHPEDHPDMRWVALTGEL